MAARCVEFGVAKVNFGTNAETSLPRRNPGKAGKIPQADEPAPVPGNGWKNDLLVAGREAVKAEVVELLRAYGSAGKAK